MTLADLVPGESGLVVGIEGRGMLAQRLVDMGLYPGVLAKLVRRANEEIGRASCRERV